jgi:nitroreductase
MPDALELLKTRKSVSAAFLAPPGPSDAELDEILTIASRVPDHGKLTPWRFVVFTGDARIKASEALAALFQRKNPNADPKAVEEERKRLARAPLVIGVVCKPALHPKVPEWEQLLSAGNAAFNIVLAAHALGYAAQWTTGWLATDRDAGEVLGLLPLERFVAFVHIGTPTAPAQERPRPALADSVSYWAPRSS